MMSRSNLTISIDTEVKEEAIKNSREEKRGFISNFIEEQLKEYNMKKEEEKKDVKENE